MMVLWTSLHSLIVLFSLTLHIYPSATLAGTVQSATSVPAQYSSYANTVKQIFADSYAAYKEFAFSKDDLLPISQSFTNDRNGWGATIFDSLSTLYIMGLTDELTNATAYASQVDFSKSHTTDTVSIFETTIRYLGAMMSITDLTSDKQLVGQATTLANNMLAAAWPALQNNVVPYPEVNFGSINPSDETSNIAEAGSLALEWSTLTKYTNNVTYGDHAVNALQHIAELSAPLPGLPAQGIDPRTGNSVGGYVTWGGGSDSYFEYLIKYARLSNTDDPTYVNAWKTAVDSSIRYLLRNSTVGSHVYLADFDDSGTIRHVGSNLECFHGGNWILGGKMVNNQTIVDFGYALTDACWNTYSSTITGIGPEAFAFESSDGNFTGDSGPSASEQDFFHQHGYYITDSHYYMRPEVLESNFYAFRASGNTKYLDRAVSAINSIQNYLRVDPAANGYAGLNNVNSGEKSNGAKVDNTPSFWFAEVLKYLYLTFDDPAHISLDEYVFNTEAHPLKAPLAKARY
ncbi:glycoside hydrolase family 47 protein [Collybiopsis luxurians FD-317 M1]|nr:glycoside hydrolase family 47 protein [Collybiopsis luxurians FD-317 M1]